MGDRGHVPVGVVPARRSGARAAGQRATPFPGAKAPAPYSPAERAELAAITAAQRDPAKRSSALAMVVFGIGAGLGRASWWGYAAMTSLPGTAAR